MVAYSSKTGFPFYFIEAASVRGVRVEIAPVNISVNKPVEFQL